MQQVHCQWFRKMGMVMKKYILMFSKVFIAILGFIIVCVLLMEARLYVNCGFSSLCSKMVDCLDDGGYWDREQNICLKSNRLH
jgi:hypothetical protein